MARISPRVSLVGVLMLIRVPGKGSIISGVEGSPLTGLLAKTADGPRAEQNWPMSVCRRLKMLSRGALFSILFQRNQPLSFAVAPPLSFTSPATSAALPTFLTGVGWQKVQSIGARVILPPAFRMSVEHGIHAAGG